MHSIVSKNVFFRSLLCVTMIIIHQNCVADAFYGVIWDKNSNDFVKILSIESFLKIERKYSSINRQLEIHNFGGSILKMTSFTIKGLIEFKTNEFNETVATGIHGEIWQIISRMSNFKLLTIESSEKEFGKINETTGDWSGLIGSIYRNETDIIPRCIVAQDQLTAIDYTQPMWRVKHKFYMKEQQPRPRRAWMVRLFSSRLWLSIVVLFFTLMIASYTIHVYKSTSDSVTDFKDHVFYTFSIFCVQGWLPNTLEKHSKILLLSSRLLAWLLFIAFGAKLISHIANYRIEKPFTDISSFYNNTNHKIVIKRDSYLSAVFRNPDWILAYEVFQSGRIIEANNNSDIEDLMCTENLVYLEAEDMGDVEEFNKCKYHAVAKSKIVRSIASGLVRGFKYKKTIDLGIVKLHEYGIMNHLKIKWLHNESREFKTSRGTFGPIKMENVVFVFAVLLCGIILSLFIMIIENIIFMYKVRDKRRKLIAKRYYN